MAAAIPAWLLISMIGAQAAGKGMSAAGQAKVSREDRKTQQERWLDQLALKNKEMNMKNEQFREKLNLQEAQQKQSGPSNLMNILGTLGSLKRQPSSTSSILAGLV